MAGLRHYVALFFQQDPAILGKRYESISVYTVVASNNRLIVSMHLNKL